MIKFIKKLNPNIKLIIQICLLMSSVFILNGLNFDATDDGNFHIRRLYDVYLSMKNGYFLSFMSNDLLYGFGYPTLGFYPYLLI